MVLRRETAAADDFRTCGVGTFVRRVCSWSKAGLNEQQLVQFVHRLKAKRMGGNEAEVNQMHQPGFLQGMPNVMMTHHIYNQRVGL